VPALLFGHGNPMHAIAKNAWTETWSAIGKALPRPKPIQGFDGGSISMLAVQLG
jgi:aromatic ring-opening dioxygenase catalytic subunit (LigB family)